jgi:hypothetical protein
MDEDQDGLIFALSLLRLLVPSSKSPPATCLLAMTPFQLLPSSSSALVLLNGMPDPLSRRG